MSFVRSSLRSIATFGKGSRRLGVHPEAWKWRSHVRWSSAANRSCNGSGRLSSGCGQESAGCIQTGWQYRKRRTACNCAVQSHTLDSVLAGRSRPAKSLHRKHTVPPRAFPAWPESSARTAPSWGQVSSRTSRARGPTPCIPAVRTCVPSLTPFGWRNFN